MSLIDHVEGMPKHLLASGGSPPWVSGTPTRLMNMNNTLDYFKFRALTKPKKPESKFGDLKARPGDQMYVQAQIAAAENEMFSGMQAYGNEPSLFHGSDHYQSAQASAILANKNATTAEHNEAARLKFEETQAGHMGELHLVEQQGYYVPVGINTRTRQTEMMPKLDGDPYKNPDVPFMGLTKGEVGDLWYNFPEIVPGSDKGGGWGEIRKAEGYDMMTGDQSDYITGLGEVVTNIGSTVSEGPTPVFSTLGIPNLSPQEGMQLQKMYAMMREGSSYHMDNATQLMSAANTMYNTLGGEAKYALSQQYWNEYFKGPEHGRVQVAQAVTKVDKDGNEYEAYEVVTKFPDGLKDIQGYFHQRIIQDVARHLKTSDRYKENWQRVGSEDPFMNSLARSLDPKAQYLTGVMEYEPLVTYDRKQLENMMENDPDGFMDIMKNGHPNADGTFSTGGTGVAPTGYHYEPLITRKDGDPEEYTMDKNLYKIEDWVDPSVQVNIAHIKKAMNIAQPISKNQPLGPSLAAFPYISVNGLIHDVGELPEEAIQNVFITDIRSITTMVPSMYKAWGEQSTQQKHRNPTGLYLKQMSQGPFKDEETGDNYYIPPQTKALELEIFIPEDKLNRQSGDPWEGFQGIDVQSGPGGANVYTPTNIMRERWWLGKENEIIDAFETESGKQNFIQEATVLNADGEEIDGWKMIIKAPVNNQHLGFMEKAVSGQTYNYQKSRGIEPTGSENPMVEMMQMYGNMANFQEQQIDNNRSLEFQTYDAEE